MRPHTNSIGYDRMQNPDSKFYMDMLIDITLNFIRAEYPKNRENINQQLMPN